MDLLDIDAVAIDFDYTCGSPLLPVGHRLSGKVNERIQNTILVSKYRFYQYILY